MSGTPEFVSHLRSRLRGEVHADEVMRGIYATDASHYLVMPSCVAIPHDADDVRTAIELARDANIPVTARGGGTSLSGQTTWTGLILDLSKYMNGILEVNVAERWARVQPGVVRDDLNRALSPHGLHFAPDPATGNRANVGGMIGNNTSGTRSIVYGKTIDHVLECRIITSDGEVMTLGPVDRPPCQTELANRGRLCTIHDGLKVIIEDHRDEIRQRYPHVMRRVSGYNLDAFLPEDFGGPAGPWNLSRIFVGSEGTLGVLLDAKVHLETTPRATALCIVQFEELMESLHAVAAILEHRPSAVELLDENVLGEAQRNRATAAMADFLVGRPRAVQIVEFMGNSRQEVEQRARDLANRLQQLKFGYAWPIRVEPAAVQRVWEVRKLGLGLITNLPGKRKGIEVIDDACVPINVLPEYIGRVLALCQRLDVPVIVYAHASVGVLHVRPKLDLHDPADVQLMKQIANEVFEMVVSYGGSYASEHGDGLLRSEFIPRFYGPRLDAAFHQVKALFDPIGIMNPGKIVHAPPMTSHLRYGNGYRPVPPPTVFQYRDQGGFLAAVEQCNGVGACRKTGSGTMCPSYMATRDEEHSTRGRANALRMAMSGQLESTNLSDDCVADVLDLCLSCKACKSECPNAVDMSRLKADVLQYRYRQRGAPWKAALVSRLPQWMGCMPSWSIPMTNWMSGTKVARQALKWLLDFDLRRPLPMLQRESLARWFTRRSAVQRGSVQTPCIERTDTVLLFCDTFTNHFEPHIGRAAVRLLEDCGFRVVLADVGCCQRPAISQGCLDIAQQRGRSTYHRLSQLVEEHQSKSIVVLEPSCASALTDDLPDLLAPVETERILPLISLLDDFLSAQLDEKLQHVQLESTFQRLMIHGHCHQKALYGTESLQRIFRHVPGLSFHELDSGCCGMAGFFGYDHYDLSLAIGEQRLFPAIRAREPGTEVIASGMSCRHQIKDCLAVRAYHWVETIRVANRS